MTTMQSTQSQPQTRPQADAFLRRTVQIDAATFFIIGLLLLLAAQPAADFFGLAPRVIAVLGVTALLFDGFRLTWIFTQPTLGQRFAWLTVGFNIAWAIGVSLLLAIGVAGLTRAGWWTLAATVDWAIVFAALQYWGARRLR